ncbi:MAG: hypothetical protein M1840_001837 [Geoglossum simile]|nr:MAG: hypothetical protein M1840_001837 [Geoglossum simile]
MLRLSGRQASKTLQSIPTTPPRQLSPVLRTSKLYDSRSMLFFRAESNRFFFAREKENKDRENGNFVDIHDVGGVELEDCGILITDVDHDILQSEISKIVGIPPYLKEAKKDEADNMPDKVYRFLYGQKLRMILPCLFGIEDKARWVFLHCQ